MAVDSTTIPFNWQRPSSLSNLSNKKSGGPMVKKPPTKAGDTGLTPTLERSHILHGNYAPAPQLLNHC